MLRRIFLILLCHFSLLFFGQENYPKNDFRSPLDIPLMLAGTFGELRSNHFHSGIDIKTKQRQGLPIYAIGDGTVTRIKVSLWGYGKVIYVAHPNGYTSVYGHLQKFAPKIETYIKKLQYQKKSYEVETFLDFGEIKVKKGELIAYSGNTGSSSGPHLHFEIRNSITEKPTNPLLYGFEVRDATNPVINKLFAYPLSKNAQINQSNEKVQLHFSKQKDGSYLANKVYAIETIGFGFSGYDRQDITANKNGIYQVQLSVNGEVYTDYDFDQFSFKETRYINTFIDYDYYGKYKQKIQLCFIAPGNQLHIYNKLKNNGKIQIKEGLSYSIELLLKDLNGNSTKIIIPVEGKKEPLKIKKKIKITDTYIIAKKPNNYDLGAAKVYFPANTFYKDFYIDLKKGTDTVKIHNSRVPAQRNFTIAFDVSKYSKEERKQLFIARLDRKLKPNYKSTYKRGNTFTTRTRDLGTYILAKDTISPKIRAKNFKENQWLTNYSYLSVLISDDLSGIKTYNATLNGKWILMEYESKKKTLTYNFEDKIIENKQYTLEVSVSDNVGNTSIFTSTFYRK